MSDKLSIEINDSYKLFKSQLKIINADLYIKLGQLQNKYNKIKNSTDENKSKNYNKYLDEIEEFQDNINRELDKHDEIVPEIIELMEKIKETLYYFYHLSIEMADHLEPYQIGTLQSLALKAISKKQRRAVPEYYKELIKNVKIELKNKTRSRSRSRGGRYTIKKK